MITFEEIRSDFTGNILNRVKARIIFGHDSFGYYQVEFDVIGPNAKCWGRSNRFIIDVQGIFCGIDQGYYIKAHEWTLLSKPNAPNNNNIIPGNDFKVPDLSLLIYDKSSKYADWITEQNNKRLIDWRGNWGFACDFQEDNLKYENIKGEKCGYSSTVCGVITIANSNAIEWKGNWAFACDFKDYNLKNERISGEKCGSRCAQTSGCTHFTWTSYNGGTCWMKSKSGITKSDAFFTGDSSMVCGTL
ncbi:unnamed protein product [Brachionus calyciflorus]|uniref:Apple domain-containing protein n=1 Tax=Brachionus calyciflorus TaxID=104777 RepID=A0A813QQ62_9BILA|nr:unnamed protein product [Brachionus calyciflorus]